MKETYQDFYKYNTIFMLCVYFVGEAVKLLLCSETEKLIDKSNRVNARKKHKNEFRFECQV